MSRIIANNIRHNDATSDSLSLDSAGNVSAPGNLSVTGTSTFTDDLAVDTDTLFVDVSADRVGINTTSPRNALHALSSNGDIRIDTSTNGGAAGLIFDVPASNGLRASGHRAKIQCEHTGSGWDSNLIFYGGNTSTEPSEQLRITSDNYLRMASGTGGIQFNGDTAAANALDDYEEGTWTPVYNFSTSGAATCISDGQYIKIGKMVFVQGYVRIQSSNTLTGDATITGLPFQASFPSQGRQASFTIGEARRFSTDMPYLRVLVNINSTNLTLAKNATSVSSTQVLTSSDFVATAGYDNLSFSGCYEVQ